jgi:hypothetical protein
LHRCYRRCQRCLHQQHLLPLHQCSWHHLRLQLESSRHSVQGICWRLRCSRSLQRHFG